MKNNIIHTAETLKKFKGRGADKNPPNRFEKIDYVREPQDEYEDERRPETEFSKDTSKSLITYNESPDTPGDASINVYRGCEHGCIYCYARPTHEYLSLSAGLDFETKIFVKENAPKLLRKELSKKSWKPQVLMLSGNTDPYQPIEKELKLTQGCLEVLRDFRNPVSLITKNSLVTRDLDLLKDLNDYNTVSVFISITTLDNKLATIMEPRTSKPHIRFETIRKLSEAGIPVGVNIAPVIPGMTDNEIPEILKKSAEAGAMYAGYVMLRLPHGVKDLFLNWLEEYLPESKQKVVNRLIELFGEKLYKSEFGIRGRGEGPFAEQVRNMFKISCSKYGLNKEPLELSTSHFRSVDKTQLGLFD